MPLVLLGDAGCDREPHAKSARIGNGAQPAQLVEELLGHARPVVAHSDAHVPGPARSRNLDLGLANAPQGIVCIAKEIQEQQLERHGVGGKNDVSGHGDLQPRLGSLSHPEVTGQLLGDFSQAAFGHHGGLSLGIRADALDNVAHAPCLVGDGGKRKLRLLFRASARIGEHLESGRIVDDVGDGLLELVRKHARELADDVVAFKQAQVVAGLVGFLRQPFLLPDGLCELLRSAADENV